MKTVIYFIITCLLFAACSKEQEQETIFQYGVLFQKNLEFMNMPRPDNSYNYPIYPDMEEWKKLETRQDMLDACQIPTSVLRKMSTQAIIQAIWEHPMLFDIFQRYQYQGDFESMFSTNNAYMELTNRSDAGAALNERLTVLNPLTTYPRFESQTLELLMSQPVFLAQLDNDRKMQIVKTAIEHDGLRQNAWEENSLANSLRPMTWLLIGRTMFAAGYIPLVEAANRNEQFKSFLEGKNYYSYMDGVYGDIPQQIIDFSKNYLNN
ncbi:MAG: hypothetical protein LBV47_07125 [Bacteroidales bacterium]|jgi:hypothetical protein|nr:hypothetical protein [Bacteroidales bacterium]